jgi:hypothetical protein
VKGSDVGKLWMTSGDNTHYKLLDGAYKLGTKFTVLFEVTAGKIKMYYNGVEKGTITGAFSKCYFKAGCYTQSNKEKGDKPTAYGEVVVYKQTIKYKGASEMKVIIDDSRIKESSTLAYSKKYPDVVYTLNDENGPIYMVNVTTGKVVGDFKLKGVTLVDPEALDVGSDGFVTLGDIGDNDLNHKEIAIYVFPEPKLAKRQTIVANKYRLAYKDGKKRNAESLIVNPITNDKFIITKASPKSEIWKIPNKPSETSVNKLTLVKTGLPVLVSDASFSRTGSHVVLRQKGKNDIVYVLKASTWTAASPASFKVSRVDQPESIAVNWDNDEISYGSEGAKSPLYTVTFPVAYR